LSFSSSAWFYWSIHAQRSKKKNPLEGCASGPVAWMIAFYRNPRISADTIAVW
jgi:hypothetical protein